MLRLNNDSFTNNEINDILNVENKKKLHDLFYNENNIDVDVEDNSEDYIKYRDNVMLANVIKYSKGDEYLYELYIGKCFSITHTFIGSTLYKDPLYHLDNSAESLYDSRSPEYLYACGTYMIIFPDTGVRICGPVDFIRNIPYFEQIMNGTWSEKSTQLPVLMKRENDEKEQKYVNGPTVYICHSPLDMILYDTGEHKNGYISVSLLRHIERALNY
jgi:hypothetical protein